MGARFSLRFRATGLQERVDVAEGDGSPSGPSAPSSMCNAKETPALPTCAYLAGGICRCADRLPRDGTFWWYGMAEDPHVALWVITEASGVVKAAAKRWRVRGRR
jgi:hypothetical protein